MQKVVLTVLVTILVYELVRSWVKTRIKRRMEKGMQALLRSPDLYQQRFKFTNKLIVKNQLLSDPEIHRKILEFSQRESIPLDVVRAKVDTYVEEIVPSFNLLSYYKVGYSIARAFIHSLYDPVVDNERRKALDHLPENAAPVYIMNHRSNVDFVLLAYILAGKVSVSYAVGEWARVWPLEHLFKSFGSYMVRRGYKEDLYHKVLERYVQMSARHGVAQAIFPEGRLSRDGHLADPKLGLLGWLAAAQADPDFDRDLVFIPVGVNYDWVLEDKNLVAHGEGRSGQHGFGHKLQVLLVGPFVSLGLLLINGLRRLMGRLKLHGYASLSFGTPIRLRDYLEENDIDLKGLDAQGRQPHVAKLGQRLLHELGRAVPATPVTMVALSVLEAGASTFTRADATGWVLRLHADFAEQDVPFVHGHEFGKIREALTTMEKHERPRGPELLDVGRSLVAHEEAEQIVRLGLEILGRNKIIRRQGEQFSIRPGKHNLLRYYANSIGHHRSLRYPLTAVVPEGTTLPGRAPAA